MRNWPACAFFAILGAWTRNSKTFSENCVFFRISNIEPLSELFRGNTVFAGRPPGIPVCNPFARSVSQSAHTLLSIPLGHFFKMQQHAFWANGGTCFGTRTKTTAPRRSQW